MNFLILDIFFKWKYRSIYSTWTGPPPASLCGNLLETQILGPHPRPTESFQRWGPAVCVLTSLSGDSDEQ